MASKTNAKKTTKKVTKSSSAKTSPAKKTSVSRQKTPVSTVRSTSIPQTKTESKTRSLSSFPRRIPLKRSSVITGIIVLVVIAALLLLSRYLVVATVNGAPITRMAYYHQLEQLDSKQALNNLVINQLILQEAQKEHVTVSQSEIDNEIKTVEKNVNQQGQKLDQALKDRHMTRQELEENIRVQKLAEKMIGKGITVTDKEIQDYIDKNKDVLPQNEDAATLKKTVADTIRNQKMSDKSQQWVANLQKNAKIKYLD